MASDRCGECRMGLGVHNTADPQCQARKYPKHRGEYDPMRDRHAVGIADVWARCACGSLSLSATVSERHDRGLHGPSECIGGW